MRQRRNKHDSKVKNKADRTGKTEKGKVEATFTEEDEPFVMEEEAGDLDSFQE